MRLMKSFSHKRQKASCWPDCFRTNTESVCVGMHSRGNLTLFSKGCYVLLNRSGALLVGLLLPALCIRSLDAGRHSRHTPFAWQRNVIATRCPRCSLMQQPTKTTVFCVLRDSECDPTELVVVEATASELALTIQDGLYLYGA